MSFWQPSFQFLASIFQVFGNLLFRYFLPLRLCLFPAGESTIFASFNHRSGNPTSFRQECLPPETNPQPDESHPCNSFSASWWIKKRILQTRYVYKIWLESDSIISFSQSSQRKRFNIWMPRSLFCRQTMHSFFSCMQIPCLFPSLPLFSPQSPIFKQLCKKPAKRREDSHFLFPFFYYYQRFPEKMCLCIMIHSLKKGLMHDLNTHRPNFLMDQWKTKNHRKRKIIFSQSST
jgi:hypothetical protein